MLKILIVDDISSNLEIMKRQLGKSGYDVTVTESGRDAIDLAKTCLPDLIIMDLKIPDLSGQEAANAIRKEPVTAHIPIIACSAYLSEEISQDNDADSVFSETIAKPVRPSLLTKIIDQWAVLDI